MKKFSFSIIFLLIVVELFAQNTFKPDEAYRAHASRANSLYEAQEYKKSAQSYDSLFDQYRQEGTITDKYNAACSWARAGNKDKAFSYLRMAVAVDKWSNLSHILSDDDLISLHTDPHWQPLIEAVKLNKEAVDAKLDKPLTALLDTVFNEDQGDRRNIENIQQQFGPNSRQADSLWKRIRFQDSVNLVRVKKVIDTYGWIGPDKVGQQGAAAIFLVIQHADSLTQVTYAPKMRAAVKEGRARSENLALLEDRILTSQGKPQLYGSQLRNNLKTGKMEFFPIEDEPNVNKRRSLMGLGPLEDYAKYFGLEYSVPANATSTQQ